jgi:hypothetical protein
LISTIVDQIDQGHQTTDRDNLNDAKFETMIWQPLKFQPISLAYFDIQDSGWKDTLYLYLLNSYDLSGSDSIYLTDYKNINYES